MKKALLTYLILALIGIIGANAQSHRGTHGHTGGNNRQREAYEKFKKKAKTNYDDFRRQANAAYAQGLEGEWIEADFQPADETNSMDQYIPDESMLPVEPKKETDLPNEQAVGRVIVAPAELKQPEPLAPVVCAMPGADDPQVEFSFYGKPCKVRFSDEQKFSLPDVFNGTLSKAWETMAGNPAFDDTLYDCLLLRRDLKLCDWAYLKLLDSMTKAALGETNEAALLKGFLFAQSGYKMRMYKVNGTDIGILFACNYLLGGKPYLTLSGDRYYSDGKIAGSVMTVELGMPQEQEMSLSIKSLPLITGRPTRLCMHDSPDLSLATTVDLNLLQFYNEYPVSSSETDIMLQWGIYARTPFDEEVKRQIYPNIKQSIDTLSTIEAANKLLQFCQYGFEYREDNEVWGTERPFFAEETLYYPYSDCEDRAILYSRLVRDLLGLDVALVYYPGHLATAVKFDEPVDGDFISVDGNRFTICDPTYKGGSVGQTMDKMNNQTATVLVL